MFTEQDYKALLSALKAAGEESYRRFNESLMPGTTDTYGVRLPKLRAMAKELLPCAEEYLALARDDSHEERLLQALVIAGMKCGEEKRRTYIANFIPKINNWAVCDTFCTSLKTVKKEREAYYRFLVPYLSSEEEYEVRFVLVLLLSHYITEDRVDTVLASAAKTSHSGYYAKMAAAWAISMCYVRFPEKTLPVIERGIADGEVKRRAVRKCCESLAVSKEEKERLKALLSADRENR
ncbi:MAG: DNA alkylation repair protein [Clostridia bacterium]|nr:DNA alkylation repair protein [Clostridia bacterium]